jgi:uroporphyrinogen-III synthase
MQLTVVLAASAASHSLILYSVGPATSRALRAIRESHLPHAQIYGDEAGTGEKLAHMILEHYNGLYKNTGSSNSSNSSTAADQKPALLFLVGEQRRDIIPKTLMSESLPVQARIQVDELVLYETGEMASFEGEFRGAVDAGERFLAQRRGHHHHHHHQGDEKQAAAEKDEQDEEDSQIMWTVIFSPTGCDAMLRTLNLSSSSSLPNNPTNNRINRRRNCFIATIGPTTRDHLRSKYGVEPDVCAEKPSPEGVGRGIEAFMRARRGERRSNR